MTAAPSRLSNSAAVRSVKLSMSRPLAAELPLDGKMGYSRQTIVTTLTVIGLFLPGTWCGPSSHRDKLIGVAPLSIPKIAFCGRPI